ncbi:unnamed protein product [Candidula unifasciata]|uniref:RING-type domain-containing protein n=1 Tax=Candidula unifasciata TaxID=100452 RepID=A0A8S3ZCW6_9EUPU|nr:unnamed protein product [Candidula unifasciata]
MEGALNSSYFNRLQTFLVFPLPNDESSASPLKLAEAGFVRPEKPVSDEVECRYCGAKYSGWSKESPLAVHRALNPFCPFLNTHPGDRNENSCITEEGSHKNELEKVTKLPFPSFESPSASIFKVRTVELPFTPTRGGYLMLFESFRLLTYTDPFSKEAAVYSEAGFIYSSVSKSVFCIFCDGELDFKPISMCFLEDIHWQKFPHCPLVNGFDFGNVSLDAERKIKEKVRTQHMCSVGNKFNDKYLVKHPEFEDEAVRIGTFSTWPRMLTSEFPADKMASCGFYYTGFNDKVKCFACGVGLYNWPSRAVPKEQHMKASPHCVLLLECLDREFIKAQNVELLVEVDDKETISGSQEEQETALLVTDCISSLQPSVKGNCSFPSYKSCCSSPFAPGSPLLDLETIKAALACQYTLEQITHAITKFFISSCGRYPNQDLLIGTLKAADENFMKLCDMSQEIINTKAELKVTKAEKAVFEAEKMLFQAKEAQFQIKEAQFEAEKAAYRREIQARNRELQRDMYREVSERKDQIIKERERVIEQRDQLLEQNCYELEMKTKEVEDLHRHIRSLQAALERQNRCEKQVIISLSFTDGDNSSSQSQVEHCSESKSTVDEFPVASCKVCLVKQSQIMFLPCKHLCCCDTCAAQLLQLGQNCPICREPNMSFEKVYVI